MNKITAYKGKFNPFKFTFIFLSFFLIQFIGYAQNEESVIDTTQEVETEKGEAAEDDGGNE